MSKQRLHRGDVVHVAKNLGSSMRHFENDFDAVVIGSYADQYPEFGAHNVDSYTLMDMTTGGTISWYYDGQLTFLRHEGEGLIASLEKARAERHAEQSGLEWIVAHWGKRGMGVGQVSLQALSDMIGYGDLWGSRGEGIDLFSNCVAIRAAFDDAMQPNGPVDPLDAVRHRIEELRQQIAMARDAGRRQ